MNLEEQKNIYLNSGVRMNPELENQIKSNSLDLAKNPAFPKTDASGNQINFLELIAYKRFNDVVSLVKRYNPQINPASIGEVSSVLMGAVRTITNAEQSHIPKLEKSFRTGTGKKLLVLLKLELKLELELEQGEKDEKLLLLLLLLVAEL